MREISGNHVYAVIMAGGFGKKLWPVSRRKMPKQFADLLDDGTMIAKTLRRISGLVPEENIFIITSELGRKLLSAIRDRPAHRRLGINRIIRCPEI